MNAPVQLICADGIDRLVTPRETLAWIQPMLAACGITRCASVTHLDGLGVPVYCAVRPTGMVLQVSNGKGADRESAQASALMEAMELYHAENPQPRRVRRTTLAVLQSEAATVLHPQQFETWDGGYFSADFPLEWTCGEDLQSGQQVWAPACSIYFGRSVSPITPNSNGLASGNHLVEATLHALYELIERDAVSGLSEMGRIRIREESLIIQNTTIGNDSLRGMVERVEARNTKVVLFWVESCIPVHTFGAVFLSRAATAAITTLNVGWGTHSDRDIAASRAITEAAQSRLVYIHGAREDGIAKPVYGAQRVTESPGYRFFDSLEANTAWASLPEFPSDGDPRDLAKRQHRLVEQLAQAGQRMLRFDLTKPGIGVPVVKILAPGLRFNQVMY